MGFLSKLLGVVSGNNGIKISDQLLFDKVIGFRGVTPGCGTSTIVQNTAIALSEQTNYSICVLDTSYMYPTQYPMLVSKTDARQKDMLDFSGDISEIITPTNHRNINLVSLSKRNISDMLSATDSDMTVDKVVGALKSYFDVILVDLSYEMTNVTTYSAIKCNRIINVADQSLKSIYYLQKSLSLMVTLAVPIAKANKVVINKTVPDVLVNTKKAIEDAGLHVIGEIPLSYEIAKFGVNGKRIYASKSSEKDIFAFSSVIDKVVDEIVQETPMNAKYLGGNKGVGSSDVYNASEVDFDATDDVKTLNGGTEKRSNLFGKREEKPLDVRSTHDDDDDDDEIIEDIFAEDEEDK